MLSDIFSVITSKRKNDKTTEMTPIEELKNILEINKNDKSKIKDIAEETAARILQNIKNVGEKIEDAKRLTIYAKNSESDWSNILTLGAFGESKTDKQTKLNTRAITQQNEAIVEMNKLIRESIRLTCCSIFFAKSMVETMSAMMVGGFKDSDGEIIKLNENQTRQANLIIEQAKIFIEQQESLDNSINELRKDLLEKDSIDKEQNQHISQLQKAMYEKDSLDEEQSKHISQLQQDMMKKDLLDEEQSKHIQNAQSEIQTLHSKIKEKENIDNAQEQEINNIKIRLENLQRELDKLLSKKHIIPFLISGIALVISLVSLVLHFVDFKV